VSARLWSRAGLMRTHKQAEKEESAVTERRTGLAYERTEVVSG
jgi:hypothetical protein